MSTTEWELLLRERHAFIGGDLEVNTGEQVLRGPITGFTVQGGHVVISRPWVALYEPYSHDGRWKHHSSADEVRARLDFAPWYEDDGSVRFELPHGKGTATLHPRGCGRQLKPEHVVGLKL